MYNPFCGMALPVGMPRTPELTELEHACELAETAMGKRLEGDHASALEAEREALEIRLRVLGPDDFMTMLSENDVAVDLMALGQAKEACERHRVNLERRKRFLASTPEHYKIQESMKNLADCLEALGETAEAEEIRARLREIEELVADPDYIHFLFRRTRLRNLKEEHDSGGDGSDGGGSDGDGSGGDDSGGDDEES
jgi:tetratricopeptide (TPR) repeat protein